MPYIIGGSINDSRSVSRVYDTGSFLLPTELYAKLAKNEELTPQDYEAFPKILFVSPPRKGGVPHIMGSSTGNFIVSQRLRDILEQLEPDVHKFVPMAVKSKDKPIEGKMDHGIYYFILPPPPPSGLYSYCGNRFQ